MYLVVSYTVAETALQWTELVVIVVVVSLYFLLALRFAEGHVQPLYPTLVVALVARHNTPLADQLSNIQELDLTEEAAFDDKWDHL